ncbi:sigma-70 family RNA polymerase sigma factor [Sphingomonas koreensis]|nr:sigma-70 family RNA polymerase sigma factor [Sphingomonas koreensis]
MADDVEGETSAAGSWLADLFKRERPRATRRIRRYVRDPDEAADVIQEAFERLAAVRHHDVKRSPEAYLQRVIRNLVSGRARRARCRPSNFIPLDEASLPGTAPAQEQGLEAQDLYRRYREAVRGLTPRTREVFLLHRVDELTYPEIARQLGISVSTVEYHMIRALVHLDGALRQ